MMRVVLHVVAFASIITSTWSQYNPNFDPNLRNVKHRRNDLSTCDFTPKEGSTGIYCGFCPNTPKAVSTRWTRGHAYEEAINKCCGQFHYPNFVMCQLYPVDSLSPQCHSNACWSASTHWIDLNLLGFFFFLIWVVYELALSIDPEWPFFLSGAMPYATRLILIGKVGFFILLLAQAIFSGALHWSVIVLLGISAALDYFTFRTGFNPLMGHIMRQMPALLGLLYWGLTFLKVRKYHKNAIASFDYTLLGYVGVAYVAVTFIEIVFVSFHSKISSLQDEELDAVQKVFWLVSMMIALRVSCVLSLACSLMHLHSLRVTPTYDWNDSGQESGELRTWFTWTLMSVVVVFSWVIYLRLWVAQKFGRGSAYDEYSRVGYALDDDESQGIDMDAVGRSGGGYGTA